MNYLKIFGVLVISVLLAGCSTLHKDGYISAEVGIVIEHPNNKAGPGESCIGDRVWNDLNANGLQEANEGSIAGVTLALYKENETIDGIANEGDTVIASVTTDANGAYQFCGLEAAAFYVVKVTDTASVLNGTTFTTGFGSANPTPVSISLAAATSRDDVDFGYQFGSVVTPPVAPVDPVSPPKPVDPAPTPTPSPAPVNGDTCIGDRIWNDTNQNGEQDAGEVGINGVTLQLYKEVKINDGVINGEDYLVGTTTSAGDGNYYFCGLEVAPVYYVIRITDNDGVLLGASQTNQTLLSIGLNPDELKYEIDFGFKGVK